MGELKERYVNTYFDKSAAFPHGCINGRLGCFGYKDGMLHYAIKTDTRRTCFIAIDIENGSIAIKKIKGLKAYTEDVVVRIANKVAEIADDFNQFCTDREREADE